MKKEVKRSIAAHDRLMRKHRRLYLNGEKGIHYLLCNYHSDVALQQKKLGRKLTREEKARAYKSAEFYYYN